MPSRHFGHLRRLCGWRALANAVENMVTCGAGDSELDFQHGASYYCSVVTVALKRTVLS